MSYYLAGCFRNELDGNDAALGQTVTFASLADMYDFHTSLVESVLAVALIGIIYKLIWLVLLKLLTMLKRRAVMRRVHSVRKKARKILTAGLRWRENTGSGFEDDAAMGDMEFGSPSMT